MLYASYSKNYFSYTYYLFYYAVVNVQIPKPLDKQPAHRS